MPFKSTMPSGLRLGRFRIRRGEWEVEYEGEDSEKKYGEALAWLKSVPSNQKSDSDSSVEARPKKVRKEKAPSSQSPKTEEIDLPSKGKLGILQFSKDSLKFPANSYDRLNVAEAMGVLLGELDTSLKPIVITTLLNRGWKKVSRKTVTSQLTGKGAQFVLSKYVIKEGDGYRLTPEGVVWVQRDVAKKLSEKATTKTE